MREPAGTCLGCTSRHGSLEQSLLLHSLAAQQQSHCYRNVVPPWSTSHLWSIRSQVMLPTVDHFTATSSTASSSVPRTTSSALDSTFHSMSAASSTSALEAMLVSIDGDRSIQHKSRMLYHLCLTTAAPGSLSILWRPVRMTSCQDVVRSSVLPRVSTSVCLHLQARHSPQSTSHGGR